MISFEGGKLLHGGDPLLYGRRYIIAAFMMIQYTSIKADKTSDNTQYTRDDDSYNTKRDKQTDTTAYESKTTTKESFSFSFMTDS